MAESGSLTVYPGAYDKSDYKYKEISGETNPVGKSHTNTTYASILSYGMTAYLYWPFDVSAIPDDATIDSVECIAKVGVNTNYNFTGGLQLFSGTTAKGSEKTFTDKTVQAYTLTPGTWTRAELNSIRLKTSLTVNYNNRYLRFYGATLTVAYTVNNEKFMLKLGGSWTDIARVFKKVSGIWVEQTELANVVDQTKRLVNGGECKTVTFEGNGSSYASVIIGETTYNSPGSVSVLPGTVIKAVVQGNSTSVTSCAVIVDGVQVVGNTSSGSYEYIVTDDCTVKFTSGYQGSMASGLIYGKVDITTGGGGESTPTLISFTIDGTSYQAEEGMTWGEWLASSYNTGGFKALSFFGQLIVEDSNGKKVSDTTGSSVKQSEEILSGYAYTVV